MAVKTIPLPMPPGWTVRWRDDGRFDLTTDTDVDANSARWTPLSATQIEGLVQAYWKEKEEGLAPVNRQNRICQRMMTNCWCYDNMGNDYWFLPTGACLYGQELSKLGWAAPIPYEPKEKPRTPDGTRDLDVEF